MMEPPNALMALNQELRQVEALSIRPLDPDDTEVYVLITRVRDALGSDCRACSCRTTRRAESRRPRGRPSLRRSRNFSCCRSLILRHSNRAAIANAA